jgi:hypothetical protein
MFGPRDPIPPEPRKAPGCRLTIVDGVPILVVGNGYHDCERFELSAESCDGIVLDWLNHRMAKR